MKWLKYAKIDFSGVMTDILIQLFTNIEWLIQAIYKLQTEYLYMFLYKTLHVEYQLNDTFSINIY